LKGLKDLVQDAVDAGSNLIQEVHHELADRPFDLLEQVPPLRAPTRSVRVVHDVAVDAGYGLVRLINRLAGSAAELAIDALQSDEKGEEDS
jgi:hypothetical protein